MSKQACKLILALDLPDSPSAFDILEKTSGRLEWVKIGMQMYYKYGAQFVNDVSRMGYKVFLDLKLYDIPNTVASAVKSLSDLPIGMLTLHASGGEEMMGRAVEAARETRPDLTLLAVTVLTSFDAPSLGATGVAANPADQVELLARLALKSGIKGLVCSPLELGRLSKVLPQDTVFVTPGVRPAGADLNEQKRVATPEDAAKAGAGYIVVGRPILKAPNPALAAEEITRQLEAAR